MRETVVLDFSGVASTPGTEEDRAVLQHHFADLQRLLADAVQPDVWQALARIIEIAHLLGGKEQLAETGADLKEEHTRLINALPDLEGPSS